MKIRIMNLENFRQFKGQQHLDFSTDAPKNVTVIMGENGAGKTTLEQAFLWCLYGNSGLGFANPELINREVRDFDLRRQGCTVGVEMEIEQEGKVYQLSRKQFHYQNGRISEDFLVRKRNENGEWERPLNDTASFATVKSILPQELSRFFFFDGERIDRMSKELTQKRDSQAFKDAVHGLVGMKPIYNAISHFGARNRRSSVIGKFNQEISVDANVTVQGLEERSSRLEQEIKKLKETYQQAEEERSRYDQAIGQINQKLLEMQDDIHRREQYDQLRTKAARIEKSVQAGKKSVFQQFAKGDSDFFLQPLLAQALGELKDADQLEKGVPHIQADTIRCLLERHRCICGAPLEHDEEKVRHLMELIPALPPNSISQMVGQFAREARQHVRHGEGFFDEFQQRVSRVRSDEQEWNRTQDKMHLLETSLADRNQAQELQRRRQQAKQQSEMCKARALSAHTQMTTAQESKKAVEEKRLRILSQNERNLKNLLYLRYAEEVAQQLKETYVRKEKETRKELEETINRIFEEIYDGGIELHVSDDYNVRTIVTDTFGSAKGDDLEQNTAQSYAVIFAFISSIIELAKKPDAFAGDDAMKVSKESYPLVMDAPLSSFDKTRIARICQALPEIAEQVIIFIKDTDGETAEKYLDSRIGSKWKLIPQNKTNTTIERRN